MNLFERLDHEIWATTMILLPKAHICSAAQHWASDFCPSVPQHCLIFKLITMTAIIIVGHWRGLICWTSLTGKNNNNYVFYGIMCMCMYVVGRLKKKIIVDEAAELFLWGLIMSHFTMFIGHTAQADWILLHLYEGKWLCSHFSIRELNGAYWEWSALSWATYVLH